MAFTTSVSPTPLSVFCSGRSFKGRMKRNQMHVPVIGNFNHFVDVVRKDIEFLKSKMGVGIERVNETLRNPQVAKTVRTLDNFFWLRVLEDPHAPPLQPRSWPRPSYPEITGVDLLMADLQALEVYAGYFFYLSKIWSKPLPEVYDPQDITDYFSCRPHVVAVRVLEVFSTFAFAAMRVRTSGMLKFLGSTANKDMDGNDLQYNFGIVLKETMLKLGPTFIKVGQSLSTRPDIIGTEISKALSELHDQIPPFPRTVAMKIIEEELGSSIESIFDYLSEEPVAAASFGQVYHGTTLDGMNVAVKVQRPNLRHVVVRDIYILRLGLGLVQKIAKRKSDLRLYADELGKGFVGELDYTIEASNASEFREAHSQFPFIRVPKVYEQLTRKRILTMEWIVGESSTDLISLSTAKSTNYGFTNSEMQKLAAKGRLLDMVNKGVKASLVQLLETGLLHADPHPGNMLYTSSGQIGFLDFGLVCRMETKHRYAMLASIVHMVNGDWASLVQSLIDMDVIKSGTNIQRVTMDVEDALGDVEFKDGIPDIKFSRALGDIWCIALKYHFRMPPYYILLLRSLASLEGLAMAGDENFKTFEASYPYVARKLLTENSAATRKILHSVVFNKKKEFQWQRLALFLRVGASRKGLHQVGASNGETPLDNLLTKANGVFDVANLIMRILPSKDGFMLRRLLMTVDGASLIRAFVSKEAILYRQQLCEVIADILCMWISESFGQAITMTGDSSLYDYRTILRDKRLKVISLKIFDSARRDPILFSKFCWVSFVAFMMASALACHRVLVTLSKTYIGKVSFRSKRYALT